MIFITKYDRHVNLLCTRGFSLVLGHQIISDFNSFGFLGALYSFLPSKNVCQFHLEQRT